jgi:Uma2 family endonuclease
MPTLRGFTDDGELCGVDLPVLHIPPSAMTHSGFRKWVKSDALPEKVKVAFLDGEVYIDMSNEEVGTHVAVKTEIIRVLAGVVKEARSGKFLCDGVLVTNEPAEVSNNPDAVFVSFKSLRAKRVEMVPREDAPRQFIELVGTPDWVLEVVSLHSIEKDTVRLRRAYHRAGIPEYWLIDARGDDVAFQILHRRRSAYVSSPIRDGWQRSRVFGLEFKLERGVDELDLWDYTLHARPESG